MGVYAWCQVLGLLSAVVLGTYMSAQRGLAVRSAVLALLFGAAGALIGGRLAKALGDVPAILREPGLLFQFSISGFDLLGAMLGAAAAAAFAARWSGLRLLDLADSSAPGLGLAIAIQRWGCWSAGCCFGRPSSLPWAVSVEPYSTAHQAQMAAGLAPLFGSPLPVHPSQLYELGLALAAGFASLLVWRRGRPGAAFGTFLALFFSVKLALTFTRFPDSAGDPPWVHLALYAVLGFAGLVLIRRAQPPSIPVHPIPQLPKRPITRMPNRQGRTRTDTEPH